MTVLWECRREGTHYSVRQSGASIRLYSNRVFHSQWNSNKPFAGGVWDCLSLPAFYLPEDSIKRVLLLGLGGGAVVRQLQIMTNFDQLNAIEIDQQHIDIARRWFGVNDDRVTLIQHDAIWTDLLHSNLNHEGVLVMNCVNSKELKQGVPALADSGFRCGYRWTLPAYENAIAVLSKVPVHARDWSRNLERSPLNRAAQRQARSTIRRPLQGL